MKQTQESQRTLSVQIVNAFVKDSQGGNPAGVVLDADAYSDAEKLQIAQKVNLSETAFVSRSKTEGVKLDFFTPTMRIAHCGHATIATFSYLASLGRFRDGETSKETVDGPRKIILEDTMAYMEQTAPSYLEAADWADYGVDLQEVLASLSLKPDHLDPRVQPIRINTGNNFIVIAVKDQQALKTLKPDLQAITRISEKLGLIGYYVFTTETGNSEIDATTRMFAPLYGIKEEAATGMAAGPLACLLHDHLDMKKESFRIEQGTFMQPASPSQITVLLQVSDGKITSLLAGGKGKVMRKVDITL